VGFNADAVGLLLTLGIPVAWHLARTNHWAVRAVALIYFALAPVAILLTGTRGAFLAGIVAMSIVPLNLERPSLRSFLLVTVLLVIMTATIAPIVPRSMWARIATIPSEIAGGSRTAWHCCCPTTRLRCRIRRKKSRIGYRGAQARCV